MFRKPKLTATKWLFASSIRQERFRNLLSSDSMKDVFNDKFFEKVDKRLSELESRQLKAHLPGALNIPHDAVDTLAPRLVSNKNAEIVVYCASATCKNSGIAAQRLTELGYRNVRTYDEGKADWIAAGLDVESGPDRDNAPPDGRPTTRTGDDVS
jgi:rhodanese-related sulfurtransferase